MDLGPQIEAFLGHLRVERRLAPRTLAMYREALQRLQASAAAAGVQLPKSIMLAKLTPTGALQAATIHAQEVTSLEFFSQVFKKLIDGPSSAAKGSSKSVTVALEANPAASQTLRLVPVDSMNMRLR